MKPPRAWWPAIALILCALAGATADASEGSMPHWSFDAATIRPFWTTTTMYGESVLPLAEPGKPVLLPLLFAPTKIIAVTSSDGTRTYREGRDYVLAKGVSALSVPPGSTIPLIAPERLVAKPGTQQFALTRRDGAGEVLFGAKLEWQDMQVIVTYTHAEPWAGAHADYAGKELPKTIQRLRARAPLRIVLLGDSISAGCNASKAMGGAPFQPDYGELLAAALEHAYGSTIAFTNLSVGGKTASWGVTMADQVAAAKPDLTIIAFGMNDACGGIDAASFAGQLAELMAQVRKNAPSCEFILVSSMLGNADWTLMQMDRFPAFRDATAKLRGPGVAMCDATSLWADLLRAKRYIDLTGNGVNHPNDFGHRLYAQLLTALLVERGK